MFQRLYLHLSNAGKTSAQKRAAGIPPHVDVVTAWTPRKAEAGPGATPFSMFGATKESLLEERLKEATGVFTGANKWHSDSEERIARIPVIKVKGNTAICDGGGGALGHPLEYIQLNRFKSGAATCIYCGLRYIKDEDHHDHHH